MEPKPRTFPFAVSEPRLNFSLGSQNIYQTKENLSEVIRETRIQTSKYCDITFSENNVTMGAKPGGGGF